MLNFLLKIIILNFVMISLLSSQVRNKWEINDTLAANTVIYNGETFHNYYQFNSASYSDKDNIAVFVSRSLSVDKFEYQIRKTFNGGTSWQTIFYDSTDKFSISALIMDYNICHPTANRIILFGADKNLYQSDNDTNKTYKSGAVIKYSNDLCKTWNKITFDSNSRITYLSMLDSVYGTAIQIFPNSTKNDSLLITDNGWNSYKKIALPKDMDDIGQISCLSKNCFFVINFNYSDRKSYILKTIDGGNTWTKILSMKEELIKFKFWNNDTGLVLAKNHLYKTIDAGKNWIKFGKFEDQNLFADHYQDFDFSDTDNGFIIGTSIYYTNDGGYNWYRESSNVGFSKYVLCPNKDVSLIIPEGYYEVFKRTEKKVLKSPLMFLNKYNGTVGLKGNIVIWQKIDSATHYQLTTYQQTANFSNTFSVFSNNIVSDTSLVLPDLNYFCMYFFDIRAFNENLTSEITRHSKIVTIYDDNSLPAPRLLHPYYQFDIFPPPKLNLIWTSDVLVDSYDIEIYKGADYTKNNLLGEQIEYKDTSLYVNYMVPDTFNIINIRSHKDNKLSDWNSYRFYIGPDITAVGESTIYKTSDISISPNPAYYKLTATLVNDNINDIKLYNSLGYELNVEYKIESNRVNFDVSYLSNGVYFLVLSNNDKKLIGSFVIQR